MINFVHGDMFATPADIRVNTVNCVGVMGAGVALAFKKRYPDMFKDYQLACEGGLMCPGKLHVWRSLTGDWVVNFPTKRDWRDPSRYEDIEIGLEALHEYLQPLGNVTVALPALGCGHGGLEWGRVSQMIERKLSSISADLRVFAPADSRRAGRATAEAPSQDDLLAIKHLGYVPVLPSALKDWELVGTVFAKGKPELLDRSWIALLPSLAPGDRELRALSSIASELSIRNRAVGVALVHANRTSEEIGQVFASKGIDVVMILPFGVLTRKTLARAALANGIGSMTLVSSVSPNEKWSRALVSQSMDLLAMRASTVLLSDPSLDWLTKRSNSKWNKLPTFFLRYDVLTDDIREAIGHANASPIGRRPADGSPNIDGLLGASRFQSMPTEIASGIASDIRASPTAPTASAPKTPICLEGHPVHLDLMTFPQDRWGDVVDLVQQACPRSAALSIEIGDSATAMILEQRLTVLRSYSK